MVLFFLFIYPATRRRWADTAFICLPIVHGAPDARNIRLKQAVSADSMHTLNRYAGTISAPRYQDGFPENRGSYPHKKAVDFLRVMRDDVGSWRGEVILRSIVHPITKDRMNNE
jgi:hypothetical protein